MRRPATAHPPARRGARRASTGSSTFAAVYALVSAVPRGRVVTYGQVARWIGLGRGARAVGWALRALDAAAARRVPWHRVIGHGGRIALGQSPSGLEQRRRLSDEGVCFTGALVDLRRHAWDPAEEALPARRSRPGAPVVRRHERRTLQARAGAAVISRARRRR